MENNVAEETDLPGNLERIMALDCKSPQLLLQSNNHLHPVLFGKYVRFIPSGLEV